MQPKSIVAIVVLSLIGLSLSVAGCTTSNQTPSATPSTTTHDAFLEKYLAEYKNVTYTETIENINAWNLTWINSTSAHLEWTDGTLNHVETFIKFPTTLDATHYLNTMNLTAYSLCSTQYSAGGVFQKTTGHAPQTYKDYEWNEGSQSNIAEYKYQQITQLDNLLIISTEYRNAIEFGSGMMAEVVPHFITSLTASRRFSY
jgi:hypothetical protein